MNNYFLEKLAIVFGKRLDPVDNFGHLVVNVVTLLHVLCDLAVRIHDCGVVAAAEQLTDFRK